jgi:hypothetical protein
VPLALEGLGIRDLAALPDKRLLVVAGAVHKPEVPFKLFLVNPDTGTVLKVGLLPEVKQPVPGEPEMVIGKAEGVTIRDVTGDKARVVILFDGLLNGAPHQSEITIPK